MYVVVLGEVIFSKGSLCEKGCTEEFTYVVGASIRGAESPDSDLQGFPGDANNCILMTGIFVETTTTNLMLTMWN